MAANVDLINVSSENDRGLLNCPSILFVIYRWRFTELNLSRHYIFKVPVS